MPRDDAPKKGSDRAPVSTGAAGWPAERPTSPMEAVLVSELPEAPGWQYEPKWDGFRAIVTRHGTDIEIWSKSGKPLGRYFPEIIEQFRILPGPTLVLDSELVVPVADHLSFDALQARLHPAASRVARLSRETPAQLILFDCLRIGDIDHGTQSLTKRRAALEELHRRIGNATLLLSPATFDRRQAELWLAKSGGALDGVVAKPLEQPYQPGVRAMAKVKQLRTADCVVGGYRKTSRGGVASLLLGLYDDHGKLDLVGFSSGFSATERLKMASALKSHEGGPGFTGRAPGGPSRWNRGKSGE